jgi:hypothetical protein
MSTARLMILAAAAALREFTVPELAAYTGANANTVRQVLHREADRRGLFERSSSGRTVVWRLRDPEAVLSEIAREEKEVSDLRSTAFTRDSRTVLNALHRIDALLTSAEDAAAQSYDVSDATEQRALAQIALNLLSAADPEPDSPRGKEVLGHWWERYSDSDEGQSGRPEGSSDVFASTIRFLGLDRPMIYNRARRVAAFAYLAARRAAGKSLRTKHLMPAAEAIAEGKEILPDHVTEGWLRRIVGASMDESGGHPPPIAVMTRPEQAPAELFPIHRARWLEVRTPQSISATHYSCWVEDWAEPLFSARLIPGVVISHEDTPEANNVLSELLGDDELSQYARATIVASTTDDFQVVRRVSLGGATFYPIGETSEGLLRAVNRAVIQALRLTTARFANDLTWSIADVSLRSVASRDISAWPYARVLNLLMRTASFYWPEAASLAALQCVEIYGSLIQAGRPELLIGLEELGIIRHELVHGKHESGIEPTVRDKLAIAMQILSDELS